MPKTPAYRQRPGYHQALVTLTDAATKKRRDYWLGAYGSAASRELYHRIIAAWEAADRCLPDPADFLPASALTRVAGVLTPLRRTAGPARMVQQAAEAHSATEMSVQEVIHAYWTWAKTNHRSKRASNVKCTLRLLRLLDGQTPASAYGPRRLQLLRDEMIRGDPKADPPRERWGRQTANDRIRIVVAMFRWAAAREMIPASVPQALSMLEPLKRGQSTATESRDIGPVSMEVVEATKEHVSRQVRALIDLQLLTGTRPGELLRLRPCDLDMAGADGVWAYRPREHKNAHRGKARTIYFGPQAQAVLKELLAGRPMQAYLFSPQEAEAERRAKLHADRRTPLHYGNKPGTNRKADPERAAGAFYTTDSYRRAIERGCDLAFAPPEHLQRRTLPSGQIESERALQRRLTPRQRAELEEWRKARRWHPNQLRHTAATNVRREFGLEAAQLVLGHSSATITDAVYAERDMRKVAEVIRRVG